MTLDRGGLSEGLRNRKTALNFGKKRKTAQEWTKPRTLGMLGAEKPYQIFGKNEKNAQKIASNHNTANL